MPKQRTMFMHTLDGMPATISRYCPLIIFAQIGSYSRKGVVLRGSVAQIRADWMKSEAWREANGYDVGIWKHGYTRVEIPVSPSRGSAEA